MLPNASRAIAIVGVGAILPDAPNAPTYWDNIKNKRYSIREVPAERWSVADYYDPDPNAPAKTYSKIGAWVRGFSFDWKRHRVPPKVAAAMDEGQQWAVSMAAEALADYGYPGRPLDTDRTGVILGTAMGGELHYITNLRIMFPEYAHLLEGVDEFRGLPPEVQQSLMARWGSAVAEHFPEITEDTMPGELANIVSGRVANVLNLRGPSFITDAACASSFAAIAASVELLNQGRCDAVISGGVDRNMGVSSFVKFCKIGALSATGTRPFGDGADGFVMGEGCGAFLLKRLADAERDGDHIYAVIRGVGASSDGKGKGITAPNPQGQILSTQRAWEAAGLDPTTATLIEAHGTSTRVGDVVEISSLATVFSGAAARIALGSAKSNVGHLKAGAGAAGLLKAVWAVNDRLLPPTLNAERANPSIDFAASPFYLNHELREWAPPAGTPRRAGVCSYGFGGTNFHLVLEEHVPGMLNRNGHASFVAAVPPHAPGADGKNGLAARPADAASASTPRPGAAVRNAGNGRVDVIPGKPPLQGILVLSATEPAGLLNELDTALARVQAGWTPPLALPRAEQLRAPERLVVDFANREELALRLERARKAFALDTPAAWKPLAAQGVFRGSGDPPGKMAFLFPGQGSQSLNMLRTLRGRERVVAELFEEADRVMAPLLERPLSSYVFRDPADKASADAADLELRQTAITQPAMLTADAALYALLAEYGFRPDFVMGHSLGEYAALVASGVLPFAEAMEAAVCRGAEMTRVSATDPGWMAAVIGPYESVEKALRAVDGYVVAANINSYNQVVIGGASEAVRQAMEQCARLGLKAVRIPVSHAFHTQIVAPAGPPLRRLLDSFDIKPPRIPVVANVTGDLYPSGVEEIKDILMRQIASPVQWVKGVETLYAQGVRVFVEVGPKKTLKGFVDNVLAAKPGIVSLYTNHPDFGDIATLNQALCGLFAAGYVPASVQVGALEPAPVVSAAQVASAAQIARPTNGRRAALPEPALSALLPAGQETETMPQSNPSASTEALVQLLTDALQRAALQAAGPLRPGNDDSRPSPAAGDRAGDQPGHRLEERAALRPDDRNDVPKGSVVISGTGLGLPGAKKRLMDPDNALRLLRGEQFVDLIPEGARKAMVNKRITRLVKAEDGGGSFETITDPSEVIKLAGCPGPFDLAEEYGVSEKLIEALDLTTQMAMAAGLDALREAGIPLVQTYKRTSKGTHLPDRWMLPRALRDETGVIFASAFPGVDRLTDEFRRYYQWEQRQAQLAMLEDLRQYMADQGSLQEINRRIADLRETMEREPYVFDRRFLFRVLSMGHSQFAEYIGARGPNTQVNAACATTAQAIGVAEDWIRAGRCRRVVVIGADVASSDNMLEWIGAGFLAVGAAATEDRVDQAALPFDRRRHGTIIGMGACALVVEAEDALRERGMRAIVELLSSEIANSAYHGTRLDVEHIQMVMEHLVRAAERRFGINRFAMAQQMVFMSHETYTPARGGSAAAEVVALRKTFGEAANDVVVANTKGFTGHPMGVGIEDVIAVKILEHGIVPPVPNFKEVDPDLGVLNLSRGGRYPVNYALHLAAGFGSQIAFTLTRRIPGGLDRVDDRPRYERWLENASGYDRAETEVVKRVLRVKAQGAPVRAPAGSDWQHGQGPVLRAAAPGEVPGAAYRPARLAAVAQALGGGVAAVTQAAPQPAAVTAQAAAPSLRAAQATSTPPAAPAAAPTVSAPAPAEAQSAAAADMASRPGRVTEPEPTAPVLDPVVAQVLSIVAAKTGYPTDMLDLDLDLEADLGVDTVKQAETFAGVREAFAIPFQESLSLRDYPTLNHVIGFVYKMRPDLAIQTAGTPEQEKHRAAETGPTQAPLAEAAPGSQAAGPANDQSSGGTGDDVVRAQVLAIVAEKTGYPTDMLDLDLDLEADLGVDTVKQAETFAAVSEAFAIPFQESLSLRDYPTLNHVIGFVYKMRPDLAMQAAGNSQSGSAQSESTTDAAGAEAGAAAPAALTADAAASLASSLAEADRIPRRVPVPALRPPLELCKSTGVTLCGGSRVVVAADRGGTGEALAGRLRGMGITVLMLDPAGEAAALETQLKTWLGEAPILGIYWLPALDVEPALEELDLPAWRELLRQRVKNLYASMRVLYDSVAGPGAFLVAGTALGGLHGYGVEGASAPLGGGVSGFCKAYDVEQGLRPHGKGVLVKVVDFEAGPPFASTAQDAATRAGRLIDETLADPGIVEVGYHAGLRYTVTLVERSAAESANGAPARELNPGTVFLVSGAAGGITSAIVADLAAASRGVFYLLDLAPAPARGDPEIALFRTDKEALKRKLIEEARQRGERPTPAQIERALQGIERREAALRAVEAVEAAGGRAHYFSLDLRDGAAMAAVMEQVRRECGRIDVLVHAAGLLVDRTLPNKEPAQFDLVFDVKVDGFFNLLRAASGLPIGATVAFSSVAGRFGNNGQSDYSAANDLLCKLSANIRVWRPDTRAIALDWTAWAGIGMAARGSVPQIMESLGIDMLPPEAGIPAVRRELLCGGQGEVLVAGRLGAWLEERDPTGGLDTARAAAYLAERRPCLPMIGEIKIAGQYSDLQVETELDPKQQPFLYDHAPDAGTPWLPGVMATEALAEVASLLAPGYSVAAVENVQMLGALKFFHMEPRTLYISARVTTNGPADPAIGGRELIAYAVLRSVSRPAKDGLPPQVKEHFVAEVRLRSQALPERRIQFSPPAEHVLPIGAPDIYKVFFHGPAYQVVERAGVEPGTALGLVSRAMPADIMSAETGCPDGTATLMAPRLLEACFQVAALWSVRNKQAMAFPLGIDSVTVHRQHGQADGRRLYTQVSTDDDGQTFDGQVVDEEGRLYVDLRGYRTVTRPGVTLG